MHSLITHIPLYTVSDISEATGVDQMTIRNWFQRKILLMENNDKPSATRGKARLFTAHTALSVGIVKLVVDAGIRPSVAAKAGIQFAHISGHDVATNYYRDPSNCFGEHTNDPVTTLLAIPTYDQEHPVILPAVPGKADIFGLMHSAVRHTEQSLPDSALIIRIDKEVNRIKDHLLALGKQELWKFKNPKEFEEINEARSRPDPKYYGWVGEDDNPE